MSIEENDIEKIEEVDSKSKKGAAHDGSPNALERLMMMRVESHPIKPVGSGGDIIPFAWRYPLESVEGKKPSKRYRIILNEERDRALMVPTLRED